MKAISNAKARLGILALAAAFLAVMLAGVLSWAPWASASEAMLEVPFDKATWSVHAGGATVGDANIGGFSTDCVAKVAGVDFGADGYAKLAVKTATPDGPAAIGITVYIDEYKEENLIARLDVKKSNWGEFVYSDTVELTEKITGQHDVYIRNTAALSYDLAGLRLDGVYEEQLQIAYDKATWSVHAGGATAGDANIGGFSTDCVAKVAGVDFGATGYAKLAVKTATPDGPKADAITVYIDEYKEENKIAVLGLKNSNWETALYSDSVELTKKITGQHDVYIRNTTNASFNLCGLMLTGPYAPDPSSDESSNPGSDPSSTPSGGETDENEYVCNEDTWKLVSGDPLVHNGNHIGGNFLSATFKVEGVNFGEDGFGGIAFKVQTPDGPTENAIGVYLDSVSEDSLIATVTVPNTGDWSTWAYSDAADLTKKVTGTHTLYIKNLAEVSYNVAAFTLSGEYTGGNEDDKPYEVVYPANNTTWSAFNSGIVSFNESGGFWGSFYPTETLKVVDVDFGKGYNEISVLTATPDTLLPADLIVMIDIEDPDAMEELATLQVKPTGETWDTAKMEYVTGKIPMLITGVHKVYILNATSGNFNVGGIKLSGEYVEGGGEDNPSSTPESDPGSTPDDSSNTPAPDSSVTDVSDEPSEEPEIPETGSALPFAAMGLVALSAAAVVVLRRTGRK